MAIRIHSQATHMKVFLRPGEVLFSKKIDEIAHKALRDATGKHDGDMLTCSTIEEKEGVLHIEVQMTKYRYFIAQMQGLIEPIVRPLSISGIMIDLQGRILMGQRPLDALQYPGRWEFPPSGGIAQKYFAGAALDSETMLRDKLDSEITGLPPLRSIESLGVFSDEKTSLYHLCYRIIYSLPFKDDLKAKSKYKALRIVSLQEAGTTHEDPNIPCSVPAMIRLVQMVD